MSDAGPYCSCGGCAIHSHEEDIPPEPPVGTWVIDRHGASHYRCSDGWSCAPTGFYAFGVWSAMWRDRGPLVECGPYGAPRGSRP